MDGALVVSISSFSYKAGPSTLGEMGHGGGFIFDCRCLPNPGREEEFKELTGRDEAVRQYLAASRKAKSFRMRSFALVEQAVKEYLRRGFAALEVSFGCTGGQHRSVYFAEELRAHLISKYPVKVMIKHLGLSR